MTVLEAEFYYNDNMTIVDKHNNVKLYSLS